MTNKTEDSFLTRQHIFAAIFFSFFLFLLFQMAGLLGQFASALIWAALLTLAGYPLYQKILKRLNHRRSLSAGVMTFIIALVIVGPSIALLTSLASQALSLYEWASGIIQSGRLEEWGDATTSSLGRILSHPVLAGLDVKGLALRSIGDLSSTMVAQLGSLLKNTLVFFFDLMIMFFAIFFFYRDGEAYYHFLMELLPFTAPQKKSISKRFTDTFRAVINGVFVIALLQGIMTGFGFALFGVPFPVFWGFVAIAAALIPLGGAALVWLPGVLYLLLTAHPIQGFMLAAWGIFLVTLPDNFLKPLLIGKKANIPTFFLFMGILGGLKIYGFLGVLFGPLIVTLLTAFVEIYREEYSSK